jgi:hypothetical protein
LTTLTKVYSGTFGLSLVNALTYCMCVFEHNTRFVTPRGAVHTRASYSNTQDAPSKVSRVGTTTPAKVGKGVPLEQVI